MGIGGSSMPGMAAGRPTVPGKPIETSNQVFPIAEERDHRGFHDTHPHARSAINPYSTADIPTLAGMLLEPPGRYRSRKVSRLGCAVRIFDRSLVRQLRRQRNRISCEYRFVGYSVPSCHIPVSNFSPKSIVPLNRLHKERDVEYKGGAVAFVFQKTLIICRLERGMR